MQYSAVQYSTVQCTCAMLPRLLLLAVLKFQCSGQHSTAGSYGKKLKYIIINRTNSCPLLWDGNKNQARNPVDERSSSVLGHPPCLPSFPPNLSAKIVYKINNVSLYTYTYEINYLGLYLIKRIVFMVLWKSHMHTTEVSNHRFTK